MPKALSLSGLAIGAIAVLVFGLDLAIAIPFGRATMMMDIGFVLCGLILCYLGWSAFKDAD